MRKSIVAVALFLLAVGCMDSTSVRAVADIDNVIADSEDYLVEVDQKRALSSATAEDKAMVVYYVQELKRVLVRFKEDTTSVSLLTEMFDIYRSLQDMALPEIDAAAIDTLVTDLDALWRAYQTANSVTVGLYEVEDFASGIGAWTKYSVAGSKTWGAASYYGTTYMSMSGYGDSGTNEDWLISPSYAVSNFSNVDVSFNTACKYGLIDEYPLEVYYSFTYPGTGSPVGYFTKLEGAMLSTGSFSWVESGALPVSTAGNAKLYIAFRYTSPDSTNSVTWELTHIAVKSR